MAMVRLVERIEEIVNGVTDPKKRRQALLDLFEQTQTDVIDQDQWNLVLTRLRVLEDALEDSWSVFKAHSQAASESLAGCQDRLSKFEQRLIPRNNIGPRDLPPG